MRDLDRVPSAGSGLDGLSFLQYHGVTAGVIGVGAFIAYTGLSRIDIIMNRQKFTTYSAEYEKCQQIMAIKLYDFLIIVGW